ncbi:MAG: carboxypeptidase regulatory-like domain-containing protein [Prolixibacteraceae bacterium]|nr:carboxypeptidase regulatory-like domain-containing protein [Prolixibacteraceae bacterium]
MKTLILLVVGVWIGLAVSAQNQGPIPKISQQMAEYFSYFPKEKVFVATDHSSYKPGETIWFRAFVTTGNNLPAPKESNELFVKLYDKTGTAVVTEIFKLENGSTPGDLTLPETLQKGIYTVAAYTSAHTSPEEMSYTTLRIDPEYSGQLLADAVAKDSISTAGQGNELFVALRNISGEMQKNTAIRFQFMNGTEVIEKGKAKTDEKGKLNLPFTLPVKTNGEPFLCELSDNKGDWKQEVFLPSNLDQLAVRFFPEGGSLVNGVQAKIGFTAFNKWGIPVDLEGSVLDQEGKSVSQVKTFTKGLGLFSLTPTESQKYKFVVTGKNGLNQSFELPTFGSDGLALSVGKTDAEFISANLIFADKQKHSIALLVNQGSSINWAADMEINGIGRIKIPSENLTNGINQLSVFSNDGKLLAQRIVFIDKKQELQISVQPEKDKLAVGESMKVKIKLTDENGQPVSGTVSVSVSDKHRTQLDKPDIAECLLMDTELETPFSLISRILKGKITNTALLDVYLIANEIKGFDWTKIRQFKPENTTNSNLGVSGISGFVTDKNGTKMNRAKVSLVNNKTMQLHTTTTNADGRFSFPNLLTGNADDFSAKATDPEGKRELKVTFNKNLESLISEFVTRQALKYSFANEQEFTNEIYFSNNPDLFTKAPKPVKTNTMGIENQRRMLSTATSILDVIKSIKPYKIMNNQIVFVGSENSINFQGGALIVIDGQQLGTDISALQNISPLEVDYINVSTNPMDIQRYTGLNSVGLIEIFMKRAKAPDAEISAAPENKYDGKFRIANPFPAAPTHAKRDARTTLLWIPDQLVKETGQFEFLVTAGKVISDFIIEVQGISGKGSVGSGTASFSTIKQ